MYIISLDEITIDILLLNSFTCAVIMTSQEEKYKIAARNSSRLLLSRERRAVGTKRSSYPAAKYSYVTI